MPCSRSCPPASAYTTLETKANFVRAITAGAGVVRCTAEAIHVGRTTATAQARVEDGQGRLLAHGTSTLLILRGLTVSSAERLDPCHGGPVGDREKGLILIALTTGLLVVTVVELDELGTWRAVVQLGLAGMGVLVGLALFFFGRSR